MNPKLHLKIFASMEDDESLVADRGECTLNLRNCIRQTGHFSLFHASG